MQKLEHVIMCVKDKKCLLTQNILVIQSLIVNFFTKVLLIIMFWSLNFVANFLFR